MKYWPIRLQLAFWYTASLGLMLILFGMLIQWRMADRLNSRTESELVEELQEILLEIRLAGDRTELTHQLDLRFGNHPIFAFDIRSRSGEVLFSTAELTSSLLATSALPAGEREAFFNITRPSGEKLRVVTRSEAGPAGMLNVRVAMPLDRSLAELRDLKLILLTVGAVVALVSSGFGYWLAARFLSPLDSMIRSAERIQAVQSRERLEVVNPHDEIGRLGLTLNEMISRLEKSADDQMQFTADAAHELRTPLAVLRSTAEVALRQPRSPEYYRDCLTNLLEDMGRLTLLSQQLLELAREDLESDSTSWQEVNLSALILAWQEEWQWICEAKEICLSVQVENGLMIRGEPDRLNRVFLNVLDNAVKYTPEGGTVSIVLRQQVNMAELTFTDSGIGISAEHLPHVFRRFYRADAARTREAGGAGLGLAIACEIVQSHAGKMKITSDGMHGTSVSIVLPLALQVECPCC